VANNRKVEGVQLQLASLLAVPLLACILSVACGDSDDGGSGTGGAGPGDGCQGSCELGATCTRHPASGSDAPSVQCVCTAMQTWCCDGNCDAGGSGGVGTGTGGTGAGTGGGTGTGTGGGTGTGTGGGTGTVDIDELGKPCSAGKCPDGTTALTYCGFAGCDVGTFCTCEIPCGENPSICPEGTSCATVSDGPGAVCMK
jgi:hypothetical protein